ncbi:peptidylprolyl isomerase [Flavobacterium sp. F372]|uniref:Peptidylprolyl isomerase n=1 Tax=Flavobacterium bernardetii TaxID=2813823 RepID=A0ABR7IY11_9FLAO|nr:peptidylprolyl isomerase [Flavobacterium bernardetii]MBC5834665.1 peptidylprolyl isomerase [Flavobacterium bernardetii]NHF70313.1 peptidylprolyl isomerase [Flavobacterium bernardetii]
MKLQNIFLALFLAFSFNSFAQNSKDVLFTIDNNSYKIDEFKRIYLKNLDLVKDDSQKDLNQYLDLFIGYKLKVSKAYKLGLQNNSKYQNELSSYRNQLSKTYLNDSKVTNQLIEEAYNRSLKEVKASHILISFDENIKGADTLAFYNKALDLKKRIEKGENFETVAIANSQDPSVADNKGNLGYFSAFRMVYPFECAAYKTKIGQISNPVRTRFGYHIIKVTDVRDNKGEVTVAHIMILNPTDATAETTAKAKQTIDDIYKKIQQGESFEALATQFSEDKSSAAKGGVLQRFGTGQLSSEAFENTAFSLVNKGNISQPFESGFGWHIVKLIEKHPVKTFDESKVELESKIKRDERSIIITNTLANKLKSKYAVETNKIQYQNVEKIVNDAVYSQTWEIPKESNTIKGDVLVIDKNKKVETNSFVNFIHSQQKNKLTTKPVKKLVAELYESWKGEQLIAYYNDNLENEFSEFKNVMDEYRDGLLLFDLMEKEIWAKSKSDTIGLQKYYETNKSKYNWKERYDVDVLSSTDAKVMEAAQKMLQKGKSIEDIKAKYNKDNKVAIMVKSGLFEKNYDILDKIPTITKGANNTYKDANYSFVVNVKNMKAAETKSFEDCKSRVINDYQQYLESTWVDELKKEFSVKVNQDVFEIAKQQLK